jgi:GTP-binding protein Era
MAHKAGFVNIIGSPNVGKSTLMNALVGESLSIITSKAQTTRHRIMGIVNGDDFQIIYSDTPGYLKPVYKLQNSMMNFVDTAFLDADIILLIVDISDDEANQEMIGRVQQTESTVIIVLNKIDLSAEDEVKKQMEHWQKTVPGAQIIPVSALRNFNVESVFLRIIEFLPESPPFYPKDTLTDKSERFFASEIVREKILLNFKQEIPYSTEVVIDQYQETPGLVRIIAFIFVSRESQKAIMLGHGGKAIKRLGTDARKDLEKFTGKKVYLELSIKVKKDWRNNEQELKRFGYNN